MHPPAPLAACSGTRRPPLDAAAANISIYWFGGRIASSMRLYKETFSNQ
jgi:hypothetical protein